LDAIEISEIIKSARTMDEYCNLAAELVGIKLPHSDYWTRRVLSVCASEGVIGWRSSGRRFAVSFQAAD